MSTPASAEPAGRPSAIGTEAREADAAGMPGLCKLTALGVVYFFLGVVMMAATASYSFLML